MDGGAYKTVTALQKHMRASHSQCIRHTERLQWGADDMMDHPCQCQNSQNQFGADKVHFSRPTPPRLIALFLFFFFFAHGLFEQTCVCVECYLGTGYTYTCVCICLDLSESRWGACGSVSWELLCDLVFMLLQVK